jgi:preprotein translocase subunit SecF
MVLLAIVLFITFAFRKVSRPVSSWKYGFTAIIALAHDVIIPVGFFAIMGHFFGGYEIDALFVTAMLVVLGFSIHDTIVVFDRVRENLHADKNKNETFENIVGQSVSETFTRSINTSLTTVLALVAVFVWGPETTRNFAMALIVGIITGTYSSIFIASPLLVTMAGRMQSKKVK